MSGARKTFLRSENLESLDDQVLDGLCECPTILLPYLPETVPMLTLSLKTQISIHKHILTCTHTYHTVLYTHKNDHIGILKNHT